MLPLSVPLFPGGANKLRPLFPPQSPSLKSLLLKDCVPLTFRGLRAHSFSLCETLSPPTVKLVESFPHVKLYFFLPSSPGSMMNLDFLPRRSLVSPPETPSLSRKNSPYGILFVLRPSPPHRRLFLPLPSVFDFSAFSQPGFSPLHPGRGLPQLTRSVYFGSHFPIFKGTPPPFKAFLNLIYNDRFFPQ